MRKLKQISLAVAIMLALSTGAMAGIIECPPAPTPPPQPSASAIAPETIETPSAQSVTMPSNPVVDVALNLLQSALTLF